MRAAGLKAAEAGLGLLNASSSHYTFARALDVALPATRFFTQPGLLWAAATKDAGVRGVSVDDHLGSVEHAMAGFFESTAADVALGGRDDLHFVLTKCALVRGNLTMLVGGRGTGKSVRSS
jgi:hypothetical protein